MPRANLEIGLFYTIEIIKYLNISKKTLASGMFNDI